MNTTGTWGITPGTVVYSITAAGFSVTGGRHPPSFIKPNYILAFTSTAGVNFTPPPPPPLALPSPRNKEEEQTVSVLRILAEF